MINKDDLNVGSLFSGIGGIDLGFEREGFKTKWFIENNPYCQKVLKKNFPKGKVYSDITEIDFSKLEKVNVLTGGFPCQDISVAGRRGGITKGNRSSLWKYYSKAISQIRPKYALIENVPNLVNLGLDVVLSDLAKIGYNAEWFSLRASDFGAPHKRERIFIVAYPIGHYDRKEKQEFIPEKTDAQEHHRPQDSTSRESLRAVSRGWFKGHADNNPVGIKSIDSNSDLFRFTGKDSNKEYSEQQLRTDKISTFILTDDWSKRVQRFREESLQGKQGFQRFKDVRRVEDFYNRSDIPEPLIRRSGNGISTRMDGYTRTERTKSIGNAVVPQVAQFIARRIKELIYMENVIECSRT